MENNELNYLDYICSEEDMKEIINEVSNILNLQINIIPSFKTISGPSYLNNNIYLYKENKVFISRICSPSLKYIHNYIQPILILINEINYNTIITSSSLSSSSSSSSSHSSSSSSTSSSNASSSVYYSQLYVHKNSIYNEFNDLKGLRFVYNDDISLSGYYCLVFYLKYWSNSNINNTLPFFSTTFPSGSHYNSILDIINDKADVACLDCVVISKLLTNEHGRELLSQLKPIKVPFLNDTPYLLSTNEGLLGPNPSQPIVVSNQLSSETIQNIQNAFLQVKKETIMNAISCTKYLPVSISDYQYIIDMMEECQDIQI